MKKQNQKQLTRTESIRFSVAGVQYSDYNKVQNRLVTGTELNLTRELNNKYDNRAIAINFKTSDGGVRIGYVPKGKAQNQLYAWRANNAISITVKITTVNKNNPTWAMFTVEAVASFLVPSPTIDAENNYFLDSNNLTDYEDFDGYDGRD